MRLLFCLLSVLLVCAFTNTHIVRDETPPSYESLVSDASPMDFQNGPRLVDIYLNYGGGNFYQEQILSIYKLTNKYSITTLYFQYPEDNYMESGNCDVRGDTLFLYPTHEMIIKNNIITKVDSSNRNMFNCDKVFIVNKNNLLDITDYSSSVWDIPEDDPTTWEKMNHPVTHL